MYTLYSRANARARRVGRYGHMVLERQEGRATWYLRDRKL